MNNHIIETIGSWGVKTTPTKFRINQIKPGDQIEIPDSLLGRYPLKEKFSRIASIHDGIASVVEGMGSAFLCEDGDLNISGGPFWSVPLEFLEPTGNIREGMFWNWGDHSPGAAQGVYYKIDRPVHLLKIHPEDVTTRSGDTEEDARQNRFRLHGFLGKDVWKLHKRIGKDRWVFIRSTPSQEG